MAKRVYQVWKGSNKFLFGGRLIFGPDAKSLVVTLLLILVPVVLFCTLVASNLLDEIPDGGSAILVVAIVFTIYRNYRYFFLFVSSSTLLCIFVFAMSALHIKFLFDDKGNVWKAMRESPISVVLMGYCFISLWFVGGLTGFHLYLIGTNQTTYENFRYRADNRINAYDLGCLKNFLEVFCTKIKPSRNDFHAYVREEPLRPPPRMVPTLEEEADDSGGDRRAKVEDDLEIGDDLLKISQRRNFEVEEIRSRGSESLPRNSSEAELGLGSEPQQPAGIRSETRHSSWGRRSGNLEISTEILAMNSTVTENRNHNTRKEEHQ
ncbi:hypothetical protein PVL29_027084 [Vitis rotundifolia]|uniref:S-acyltransferase n=1 Tax=Vitis rotundifolia TaxID=103349 RepID=A0AA38YI71_VITRO|nr:hypothetical protein PVL29_027084 [Vitis rotundifolia]